jgi:hypothetical protein
MKHSARILKRLFTCLYPSAGRGLRAGITTRILAIAVLLAGSAFIGANQKTSNERPTAVSKANKIDAERSPSQTEQSRSGWLYVLDSNQMKNKSQVLLVDPEQGRVIRTFKAGQGPDMVLSPDGTRLYLTSTLRNRKGQFRQSILEVIDTTSGKVLQRVDNPERWVSTVPDYPSQMAISPDGHWVYIFKSRTTQDEVSYYVATFDTVQGRFLSENVSLPHCGAVTMLAFPDGRRLNALCYVTNDIRFLELTDRGLRLAVKTPATPSPSKLVDCCKSFRTN